MYCASAGLHSHLTAIYVMYTVCVCFPPSTISFAITVEDLRLIQFHVRDLCGDPLQQQQQRQTVGWDRSGGGNWFSISCAIDPQRGASARCAVRGRSSRGGNEDKSWSPEGINTYTHTQPGIAPFIQLHFKVNQFPSETQQWMGSQEGYLRKDKETIALLKSNQ